MVDFFYFADGLLRGHGRTTHSERAIRASILMAAYIVLFGMAYGAVMGSFGGFRDDRLWQALFSALKVPLLLFATFFISLPSFFVLNTLLGLRSDFAESLRALLATQASLAIILSSLAPFTAMFYLSSSYYRLAVLFNGLMFAIASLSAQWVLRRNYHPLIRRDKKHRWLMWLWIGIYVFVGIQMGWVLRPFVGDPKLPAQFFRAESWGNAYVIVIDSVWKVISR